jgi:hypothetical protein
MKKDIRRAAPAEGGDGVHERFVFMTVWSRPWKARPRAQVAFPGRARAYGGSASDVAGYGHGPYDRDEVLGPLP